MAPTPTTNASVAKSLDWVLQFIKGGNLLSASKPGFGHALRLSYNTISKDRLTLEPEKKVLTYRYRFNDKDRGIPTASVGFFAALMDELSTLACYAAGSPSAPGVSLQMQTELLLTNSDNQHKRLETTKEVDIVNTVTKLGRTVSYMRTDFICVESQKPLAYSSHVKYMPSGSFFMDLLFNNRTLHQFWFNYWVRPKEVPIYEETPLISDVIQSHLEFHGMGRATFHATREHTNPMGGLHGGCHAMVMEEVATPYAKAELRADTVTLEAISIDFLGVGKGSIDILCETIGEKKTKTSNDNDTVLHVRVLLRMGTRIASEGKLRFSCCKKE